MTKRLIFISCGQLTELERDLGRLIKNEVDATDEFEGYFADTVQSLQALSSHVMDALRRAEGAIVILQPRGRVTDDHGHDHGVRSSVWINQELSILAYRAFFETTDIPILAFKDPAVTIEGAMTAFIVNPRPLVADSAVVSAVGDWLRNTASTSPAARHTVFQEKWLTVTPNEQILLISLIAEGGRAVKETAVRRRLRDDHALPRETASHVLCDGTSRLTSLGLIQVAHNAFNGDELTLHPSWEWNVRHAVTRHA